MLLLRITLAPLRSLVHSSDLVFGCLSLALPWPLALGCIHTTADDTTNTDTNTDANDAATADTDNDTINTNNNT